MRARRHRAGRRGIGSFAEMAGPAIGWAMRRSAEKFLAQTSQFAALSSATLDNILALNGGTEYGRRCGLNSPTPRRAFGKLPLTTYADYLPYIERMAAGEQNILSGEPVLYFPTTSGTTGPPKLIPITRRQSRLGIGTRITSMGLALRAGVLKPMRGRFLTLMTEHLGGSTAGGVPRGAATTLAFKQLGNLTELILTSPADVVRLRDQQTARYLHLLFALGEEHLWTIVAFFPATILYAMRTLQAHGPQLVRDLADGTLDRDLPLEPDTRSRLEARLRPDRARARALTALLDRGAFTVPNIWPDVGSLLTATGGAFRFYTDQLGPFLGDVPVFSPVYSASEGTMGFGFSAGNPYYLLLPSLVYIELLPVESMDDPGALPIPAWEAEPGRSYEMVITNLSGFNRYRLFDIVRVVDFYGQTPIIEFVERRGQVIDILGEKTAEHHIVAAMETACHALNAPLVDYFVVPDTEQTPARYLLAIEGWESDGDHAAEERAFLKAVETALRHVSPDYDEERQLNMLAGMAMLVLKPGAFDRYREGLVSAGASASQVKTPHVVPDPGFARRNFAHEVMLRIEATDS